MRANRTLAAALALAAAVTTTSAQAGRVPAPAPLDAISAELAQREYAFAPTGEAFTAPNRAQGLRARIGEDGLAVFPRAATEPSEAPWTLSLRTVELGRGRRGAPIGRTAPGLDGSRVALDHGVLREWFANDARGLEHGWDLATRPPGGDEPVWIGVAVDGLVARVDAAGRSATFSDADGVVRLDYRGLVAFDARGRELAARLVPAPGGGLGVEVEDRGAAYPVVVDPVVTTPGPTITGTQSAGELGFAVAGGGDVDGDGYDDLLVGARRWDGGQQNEGAVFLYRGTPTGVDTTPFWQAESDQVDAELGSSVAIVDTGGDAYADVLVGAPLWDDPPVTQEDEGEAFLWYGSISGPGNGQNGKPSNAQWILNVDQYGDGQAYAFAGRSVASAGDVNGDGLGDIVVGAPGYDANGMINVDLGRVYVLLSAQGFPTQPWILQVNEVDAEFGYAVASAGDVDGDGRDEVVVGAPGWNGGFGRSYAFQYPSGAIFDTLPGSGGRSGQSVAGAGDVNADGFDDVIVGSPFFGGGLGLATLSLGSNLGGVLVTSWVRQGTLPGGEYGTAVAGIGDVDGDGSDDWAVGAPGVQTVEVFPGFVGGAAGAPTVPDEVLTDATGSRFGESITRAGDLDGDGGADFAIGAPDWSSGANGGAVFTRLGSAGPGVPGGGPTTTLDGTQLGFLLAGGARNAGDVDGDGIEDLAVLGASGILLLRGSPTGVVWPPVTVLPLTGALMIESPGDADRDGYADLLVGEVTAGTDLLVESWLYRGGPTGYDPTPAGYLAEATVDEFVRGYVSAAGDVDGDGFPDILAQGSSALYLFRGAPGGFAPGAAWISAHLGTGTAAGGGDLNGDGFDDVCTQTDSLRVYFGSASGLPSQADLTLPLTGLRPRLDGDVDGDGFDDLLTGQGIHRGSPAGPASSADWAWPGTGSQYLGSFDYAGDVNGDARDDVVRGLYSIGFESAGSAGTLQLFLGRSGLPATTPDWSASGTLPCSPLGPCSNFGLGADGADLDGDGLSDVVSTESVPGNPTHLIHVFAGQFGGPSGPAPPITYCTAKASSSGCLAQITTSDPGKQPLSGLGNYRVIGFGLETGKQGLLVGGTSGPIAVPFWGGTLCTNPAKRGPIAGSGGAGPCTGLLSTTVNDGSLFPAGLDAGAGNSAWYQYWYRDPANGAGYFGTALSDAVQLDFQ